MFAAVRLSSVVVLAVQVQYVCVVSATPCNVVVVVLSSRYLPCAYGVQYARGSRFSALSFDHILSIDCDISPCAL